MAKFRTHYDNLKVARDAPENVIRAAYKALCQKYHPDKFDGSKEEGERILKIVSTSYQVLIDPEKRNKHDIWIKDQELEAVQPSKPENTAAFKSRPASSGYHIVQPMHSAGKNRIKIILSVTAYFAAVTLLIYAAWNTLV